MLYYETEIECLCFKRREEKKEEKKKDCNRYGSWTRKDEEEQEQSK